MRWGLDGGGLMRQMERSLLLNMERQPPPPTTKFSTMLLFVFVRRSSKPMPPSLFPQLLDPLHLQSPSLVRTETCVFAVIWHWRDVRVFRVGAACFAVRLSCLKGCDAWLQSPLLKGVWLTTKAGFLASGVSDFQLW